jgi:putative acetyltransferase
MDIRLDDLTHPALHALLNEHLQHMYELSPPESVHALDLDRLRHPSISFWTAWDGDELLGCGAMKELDATHGEVKSMRTPAARRGTGAAKALLNHIIQTAQARGYQRLSLETGPAPAFEAAQRLYERHGFTVCGPFADYVLDPFSVFMTKSLARAPRPACIVATQDVAPYAHVYPQSQEAMGPVRALGRAAGLQRLGINVQTLPPGSRSSWPHAESDEEEFAYVLAGEVHVWLDGTLHRMVAGDLAAFPAGTGQCHCFINNSAQDVTLLVGGEAAKLANRIYYPLNPSRRQDLKPGDWWDDVPQREMGAHDGLPDAAR